MVFLSSQVKLEDLPLIKEEKDIMNMLDYFKRNNFRENPVCEYVLPRK